MSPLRQWWDDYPAKQNIVQEVVGQELLLDLRDRERRHPDDFDPDTYTILTVWSVSVGLDSRGFFCSVTASVLDGDRGEVKLVLFNTGDVEDEEGNPVGKHELRLPTRSSTKEDEA